MFSHFCSEGKACVTWLPPDIIATLHQKSSDLHEKVSLSNVEKKKKKETTNSTLAGSPVAS